MPSTRYTLVGVCVTLLLSYAVAGCPKQCRCPDTVDNLIFEMHCNNASLSEVPDGQLQEALFVDLSFNNITTLKNDTFFKKQILKLVRLYLNNNGLKTIEVHAFRGLTQLKLLNLEMNDISVLLPSVFQDSSQLEVLNLNRNQNLQLPDTGFNLPVIDILLLKECGLKTIPTQFFNNMLNLQYLFLRGNALSVFDPQLVEPLTQLKRLDLRENKFTSLQFDLHQTLPETLVVDFEGNPLHCECDLESTYSLNKEKKLYDFLTCGTPKNSSLHKFLLETCTNTTTATGTRNETAPLETSSAPSPPPTTSSTTEGVTSQAIVPIDQDTQEEGDSSDRIDTTREMEGFTGWIALSAVALALIIVGFITVIIRRQTKSREYPVPRRFKLLEYDDEEQSYIT